MPGLPAIGRLNYNGIEFDGALEVSVTVDGVPDEAGLTIMYQRSTIRAHAVVTNSSGTDSSMEQIRTKLLEPARQLIFFGKGFGNDMNVGPADDVCNGPMPRMINWTSIGANKACEFDWECVVCNPKCDNGRALPTGIMSLAYTISWSIDEQGLTTKTYSGYIQIAQGRQSTQGNNGRRLRDTADKYLDRLSMQVPPGYRRTSSRDLSMDRSRLGFTVADSQIATNNPYPANATMVRGRHRVHWQRGPMGAALMNSIDLEFSPKLKISGIQAWAYFLKLVTDRLNAANAARGTKCCFLDGLNAEEDIFGLPCNFSVNYRILGGLSNANGNGVLAGFVSTPGLWKPLDTRWSTWKASMSDVFNLRGLDGDEHTSSTDLIIDLCDQGSPPTNNLPQEFVRKPAPAATSPSPYLPDKDSSYLSYNQVVAPSAHMPVVRQAVTQPYRPSNDNGGGASQDGYPTFPTGANNTKDILQEGGAPRYGITLVGTAERAGYPIAKPVLKTSLAGGAVASGDFKQVACQFAQRVANSSFGVPVFTAKWVIEYMLTGTPAKVLAPDNIAEGFRNA